MKRLICLAVLAVIAETASAGIDLLPITGTQGALNYDAQTGEISPAGDGTRWLGWPLWDCSGSTGYFTARIEGDCLLDWGDIQGNLMIGGLGFDEYTNSQASCGDNQIVIVVYANDNGWGDTQKRWIAGYTIANVPGSDHPVNEYWGYRWRIERSPFLLSGDDLDGDGLADFSYAMWYQRICSPGARMGPSLCEPEDANAVPSSCPGIMDAFDLYLDPDFEHEPNMNTKYVGSFSYGGEPFAQIYWKMFAHVWCPNGGPHYKYCSADIGNCNCVVDLADLAQLLSNFSCESGCTQMMGDIYPLTDNWHGDGVIDLRDLAELLSQYGDECGRAAPHR